MINCGSHYSGSRGWLQTLANILVFLRLLQQETLTSGLADLKFAASRENDWDAAVQAVKLLHNAAKRRGIGSVARVE